LPKIAFETTWPEIQWLATLYREIESIVDFGCGEGWETFALMDALEASEAYGIDVDAMTIRNAKGTFANVWQEARSALNSRDDADPDKSRWWRSGMPSFAKGLILDEVPEHLRGGLRRTAVHFIEADMTQPIRELPTGHFDLAYCKSVLYQILADQGIDGAQAAVGQMARVVRSEGLVVAVEPCSIEGEPPDLHSVFDHAGLETLFAGECAQMPCDLGATLYAYQKTQRTEE
jgi:SAM-dependent methyltransferase